jgi:hypothetical protein
VTRRRESLCTETGNSPPLPRIVAPRQASVKGWFAPSKARWGDGCRPVQVQDALTVAEQVSPLARRPYDLRHACLSTRLNGGVFPTQVAEWAGHSADVLLRIYVKCVVRRHSDLHIAAFGRTQPHLASSDKTTQAMRLRRSHGTYLGYCRVGRVGLEPTTDGL